MTDRNAYMRDYMARRRAEKPASQKAQLQLANARQEAALRAIIDQLGDSTKPAAVKIRETAQEGLA